MEEIEDWRRKRRRPSTLFHTTCRFFLMEKDISTHNFIQLEVANLGKQKKTFLRVLERADHGIFDYEIYITLARFIENVICRRCQKVWPRASYFDATGATF